MNRTALTTSWVLLFDRTIDFRRRLQWLFTCLANTDERILHRDILEKIEFMLIGDITIIRRKNGKSFVFLTIVVDDAQVRSLIFPTMAVIH
jgi:hypothetical protein